MNALLTLIKKDITLDYGILLNPKAALHNKKMRNQLLLALLGILVLGAYIVFAMKVVLDLLPVFLAAGMGEAFLASAFGGYLVMVLIFTVAPLVSRLYFSNDIRILQTLPVSEQTILGSKVVGTSIQALIFATLFVVPMVLKYGIATNQGFLFYLIALLGTGALTLITVSLLTLAVVAFMRVASRVPNFKTILQFVGMGLTLVLSVGIQFAVRGWAESQAGSDLALIEAGQAILRATYTVFPHVRLMMRSLLAPGLGEQLLMLAALLAPSVFVAWLSVRLGAGVMMRGVSDNRVVGQRRRTARKEDGAVRSVLSWIARKDLEDIFRTPIYFFNIGLFGLIFPLILLVPFFTNQEAREGIGVLQNLLPSLPLRTAEILSLSVMVGFLVNFFLGTTATTASTSFTREGKNIWLMQSLPISYEEQVNGRLRASILFQALSGLPFFLILTLALRPNALWLLGYVAGGAIAAMFTSRMGLWIDIRKPKLQWDNPQQAVKQNANVFALTMGGMLYIALWGFLAYQMIQRELIPVNILWIVGLLVPILHLAAAFFLKKACIDLLRRNLVTYSAGE